MGILDEVKNAIIVKFVWKGDRCTKCMDEAREIWAKNQNGEWKFLGIVCVSCDQKLIEKIMKLVPTTFVTE